VKSLTRIDKEILQALVNKTGKSKRTVYRMIENIMKEFNYTIPSKRIAANILASRMGIKVNEILDKNELTELQKYLAIPVVPPTIKIIKKVQKTPTIRIDRKIIEAFGLPPNLAKEAKRMAEEVYPRIYVLENSLRYVVMSILRKKYGEDWWNRCNISREIRKNVENRIKSEKKNRWHGRRGSHPIFYTDFDDLRSIIINNWEEFKELFPDQIWVQSRLKDIEPSRNIIAHNNPLPQREIERLKIIVEDFRKQLMNQHKK